MTRLSFIGIILLGSLSFGQEVVFSGTPQIRISEGGVERTPETLGQKEAGNYRCQIREINGKFYWSTRGDTELRRETNTGFITYIAINGAGYIRIIKPETKPMAKYLGPTEEKYDYVEHMLMGLKSVTYYGNTDE